MTTTPAPSASEQATTVGCNDCGLPYGSPAWADVVLPDSLWQRISPSGNSGGLLCFNCINARLYALRLRNVPYQIESGPLCFMVRDVTGRTVESAARPAPGTSERVNIVCTCAHIPPTMPTYRADHLAGCPMSAYKPAIHPTHRMHLDQDTTYCLGCGMLRSDPDVGKPCPTPAVTVPCEGGCGCSIALPSSVFEHAVEGRLESHKPILCPACVREPERTTSQEPINPAHTDRSWPTAERVRELANEWARTRTDSNPAACVLVGNCVLFDRFVRERERAGKVNVAHQQCPEHGTDMPNGTCAACAVAAPPAPGDEAAREAGRLLEDIFTAYRDPPYPGRARAIDLVLAFASRFPRPADSRERESEARKLLDELGNNANVPCPKCGAHASRDQLRGGHFGGCRLAAVLGKGEE